MCGIAGIAGPSPPDQEALLRMAQAMVHRGPDDQGIWSDERAGLAFRRLSIIDLNPRSNQPLHHAGLHLVFNGEIYNYRELREELRGLGHVFLTEGDGEVLLRAWSEWGADALDRVNGMFALAVWDEREASLTLASDPFGEKPLYYSQLPTQLAFASDIRALRAAIESLGAPDDQAVDVFVARGLMPPPEESFFAGVRRLPAAHRLVWQGAKVAVDRYWAPRTVEVPRLYEDAVCELRGLLIDSIRLRLRSDVPVGTSLSGGVDSSTIVALSAELGRDHRRHAFTARFPGHPQDEWRFAEQVGRAAEVLDHHGIEPDAQSLAQDIEQLVRDQEEPFASTSIYSQWCVMRAAKEAGVIVLLDGQGADELFAGYPWVAGFACVSQGAVASARALADGGLVSSATFRALVGPRLPAPLRRLHFRRLASPYVRTELIRTATRFELPVPPFATGSSIRRELISETFVTSLPTLLRYADRSSMAHSREVRLPFLDRRVAEFALSLPPEFLYRDGVSKRILRDVGRGLVPEPVLARRDKIAFEPPQSSWLSTPAWMKRIADVLLDPATIALGVYDQRVVEADLRAGAWRDHAAVWRALCAELWRRSFARG